MDWPMDLLKETDFSKETDLKDRLYQKLFEDKKETSPRREALSDDEVEVVAAAGNPQEKKLNREKDKRM